MSKGAVSFNESNVEYYTPRHIVDLFGPFDYDPATTVEQAEYLGIPNYDTVETDGLFADWTRWWYEAKPNVNVIEPPMDWNGVGCAVAPLSDSFDIAPFAGDWKDSLMNCGEKK